MTSPTGIKPKMSLREMISQKRKDMTTQTVPETLEDPYKNAQSSINIIRGATGVVLNEKMIAHACEWDEHHIESPLRYQAIAQTLSESGLLDRCKRIENDPLPEDAIMELVSKIHDVKLFHELKRICKLSQDEMEALATKYDSIYFNEFTFDAACTAVNSVIDLLNEISMNGVENGFTVVRPPGHHAMRNEFNGFCFFNNVAIGAEYCINKNFAKKILILDYDVHHGQGIQQAFYNRNDVLYFSIHRYEHGTFWPNLAESNYNFIGEGAGLGYNINVPLNEISLTDNDYLAIVLYVLLPVAFEFTPDLIIISGGYDLCIGDPKGEMNVTPAFFSHLITLLSCLANSKIAVILEGGYFVRSLAESVKMTVKALLGDPCPVLDPFRNPRPSVIEVINNLRLLLSQVWKCFNMRGTINLENESFIYKYFGKPDQPPFPTRQVYKPMEKHFMQYSKLVDFLIEKCDHSKINQGVSLVFDERLTAHAPKEGSKERPERPQRLEAIKEKFEEFNIFQRCKILEIKKSDLHLFNCHNKTYYSKVMSSMIPETNDVYHNDKTQSVIELAVCGLITAIDDVMNDKSTASIAVIRPPGHHAEFNAAMGFCLINNVGMGAQYILKTYKLNRILIIDFDVHHGNGTQDIFYDTNKVMYISIHRFDNGNYFPKKECGNYDYHGSGIGEGYNVNIPFNTDKMGDTEYLAVFLNIILPLFYSYNPEIVLVSAGFDAGINDPLGGYKLSPEMFGYFIQLLKPFAKGKMVVTLEGGYNLYTLSFGITMCVKNLLGDPLPKPEGMYKKISPAAVDTIAKVTRHFQRYWPIFAVNNQLTL